MSEQELKRAFANAVAEVKPLEAPYRRLMERRQTRRTWKFGGWVSGGVAAVVAVLLGPVGLLSPAAPQPAPSVLPSPTRKDAPTEFLGSDSHWGLHETTPGIQQLLKTPPRGTLAKDKTWTAALLKESKQYMQSMDRDVKPQVLFADDIGNMRMVILAYVGDIAGAPYQTGAVMIAERGASPQRLVSARSTADRIDGRMSTIFILSPYTRVIIPENFFPPSVQWRGFVEIGLAPQGCRIATGTATNPTQWRDQPLGDYFVDTSGQQHFTDRVTCGGKVRVQTVDFSEYNFAGEAAPPTEEQLATAIAGARGQFTSAEAREILETSRFQFPRRWGGHWRERRLLFGGELPSFGHRRVFVTVAEYENDCEISVHLSTGQQPIQYAVSKDLLRPRAVIAVLAKDWQPGKVTQLNLVLAPRGAVRLEYQTEGEDWKSMSLKDGLGELELDASRVTKFIARDATGEIVGEGSTKTGLPEVDLPDIMPIFWQ